MGPITHVAHTPVPHYPCIPLPTWGTGDMGHMGNEAHRGKVVQGVWGAEVWGIWAMRPTAGMGYRGMGNRVTGGMGYMGYGPHGQ